MAVSEAQTFLERIPVKNNLKRAWELVILLLLISLLYCRLSSLDCHGLVWLAAFLCEAWFTFVWLLNMNIKWNPVKCITFPERLSKRREDLPAVDMFVTTADPKLEPPMVTVNTVLSLLAVDYPAHKLACYVSDDACSPITYYALVEAAKFARSWVPFCKKYHVRVRAPFAYFSAEPASPHLCSSDFLRDWEVTKSKYEELGRRIEAAQTPGSQLLFLNEDVPYLSKLERGNHPSIVKVIWEDKVISLADGIPHLIYVAREKKSKHPHHYKAGAMNVLTRVSGVMTNAPFMLNVDCDMLVNNPEVILHAMCPLLGFHNDQMSGFVQFPQHFHGVLEDDPYGNKFQVFQHFLYMGLEGLQCSFYAGTGCFHRRKVIYGEAPELERGEGRKLCGTEGKPSPQELPRRFGCSMEMQESAAEILSGVMKTTLAIQDLAAREEAAKQVASCTYELNTRWGEEVGWVYGSTTEDVQTGLRIHATGWRSVCLDPEPPAFLGSVPLGGPASMTQCKRWATGLLEVLVGRHSPLLGAITRKLGFRQCLAYFLLNIWALQSVPELCYALLAPYCAFSNTSFLPKASEPMIAVPTALSIFDIIYTVMEYLECGLTARAWWNNQRMHTIRSTSAFLFGLLSVVMKVMGVSETTFEVTSKEQSESMPTANGEDLKRFTFDSSPLFIPGTTIMFLNLAALLGSSLRVLGSSQKVNGGPGIGELVCSGWVVLSFWPFVRGLFSKGAYGIPWSTIAKASILASMFLLFCKWTS